MQLIWAMFSLGAIISPMLVYIFGTKMLFILAFISLLNSIAYKYLNPKIDTLPTIVYLCGFQSDMTGLKIQHLHFRCGRPLQEFEQL